MRRFVFAAAVTFLVTACADQPSRVVGPAGAAFTLESSAVIVDPALTEALATATSDQQFEVIVTFDRSSTTGTAVAEAVQLTGAGALGFGHLPMVAALATPAQIAAIQTAPGIVSLYLSSNERFLNREGAASVRADEVHALGYTGEGVGIAILDSGIDGNHPDLAYPSKTVQNAMMVTHTKDVYEFAGRDTVTGLKTPKPVKKGYELFVENVTNTDTDNGHGTHVAGSAAGTGSASGGRYAGVAPGAHLIGVRAAAGPSLPGVMILAGFDYIIENREEYNIQVVNNSWGSSGAYNPADPIPVATKEVHDAGITVVFAGGNEGPDQNSMNRRSVAPWVISVAAGCKTGDDPTNSASHCNDGRSKLVADFSSRGIPGDELQKPDILAPGVHIVSTRALQGLYVNTLAANHDIRICNIPDGLEVYYTCIDGTSMASPHVAGIVALMEQASGGTLTPDQALSVLQSTARTLPGYADWEVGAGYADAFAAVQAVRR